MDEAVAGHATRIEIELAAGDWLTVRDNGRGIPVDPHPRFPDKSALEVILTTLHAGGKFGGDAYRTSGGLHGVGVSVVNALADALEVEVARDRRLWRQILQPRRAADRARRTAGRCSNRRGTTLRFHPDPEIFGSIGFRPALLLPHGAVEGLSVPRPGNPLELRSGAASPRRRPGRGAAALPGWPWRFPRGQPRRPRDADARARFSGGPISPKAAASNGRWRGRRTRMRGFSHSYCNTIPTPEGGTHEAGLRSALLRGVKGYGELVGNRRGAQATGEDVTGGAAMLLSLVHPRSAISGPDQGAAGLGRGGAAGRERGQGPFRPLARRRSGDGAAAARPYRRAGRGAPAPAPAARTRAQDRDPQAAAAGQARRLHS